MSSVDKAIRVLIALTVFVLYATGTISGTLAIVLIAVAVIFLLTVSLNFCPIYFALGISSRKKDKSTN
ncbi:MAG: DUF2892 domain-containing protein [Flavobacteriales bacterium]|nr:DUF2892 domain-containing protein [Flavobacteriales bacterium]